jgi:hypothetical protein
MTNVKESKLAVGKIYRASFICESNRVSICWLWMGYSGCFFIPIFHVFGRYIIHLTLESQTRPVVLPRVNQPQWVASHDEAIVKLAGCDIITTLGTCDVEFLPALLDS